MHVSCSKREGEVDSIISLHVALIKTAGDMYSNAYPSSFQSHILQYEII